MNSSSSALNKKVPISYYNVFEYGSKGEGDVAVYVSFQLTEFIVQPQSKKKGTCDIIKKIIGRWLEQKNLINLYLGADSIGDRDPRMP